jgi:hypothetical protein
VLPESVHKRRHTSKASVVFEGESDFISAKLGMRLLGIMFCVYSQSLSAGRAQKVAISASMSAVRTVCRDGSDK